MIIARATRANLDDILTLVNAAYRGIGAKAGWTSENGIVNGTRVDAATVETLLAQERTVILLLRRDATAQPIGCYCRASGRGFQLRAIDVCDSPERTSGRMRRSDDTSLGMPLRDDLHFVVLAKSLDTP